MNMANNVKGRERLIARALKMIKRGWNSLGTDEELSDPELAGDLEVLRAEQAKLNKERQAIAPKVEVSGKVPQGAKKGRARGSSTREDGKDEGRTIGA